MCVTSPPPFQKCTDGPELYSFVLSSLPLNNPSLKFDQKQTADLERPTMGNVKMKDGRWQGAYYMQLLNYCEVYLCTIMFNSI